MSAIRIPEHIKEKLDKYKEKHHLTSYSDVIGFLLRRLDYLKDMYEIVTENNRLLKEYELRTSERLQVLEEKYKDHYEILKKNNLIKEEIEE